MKHNFFAVLSALLMLSLSAHAERYRTWVDENGVVRHEPVREKVNPLLKRAEEVKARREDTATSTLPSEKDFAAGKEIVPSQSGSESTDQAEPLSPAEREASPPLAQPSPKPSTSFSQLKAEDYIDAEELAKNGFVRDTADGRFYSWVDAQGVIHSSPYTPVTDEVASLTSKPKSKFSPFQITEIKAPSSRSETSEADEYARKLFKLDEPPKGIIHSLSTDCCQDLPFEKVGEIDLEDGYLVEFGKSQERFPFSLGESVYEVVELPPYSKEYVLSIRSFVNKKVFVPSLVFLNEKMEPVRVVRNVVHDYTAENWFRHGYLEGWVKVEPKLQEKYLMILTLPEDTQKVTVIPGKKKPVSVEHVQFGILHVSIVK